MYCRLCSIVWESYKDQSTTFIKNLKKVYRLSMRTLASFCSRQGLLPASVPPLWNYCSHISLLSSPGFSSLWCFAGARCLIIWGLFKIMLSEILQLWQQCWVGRQQLCITLSAYGLSHYYKCWIFSFHAFHFLSLLFLLLSRSKTTCVKGE